MEKDVVIQDLQRKLNQIRAIAGAGEAIVPTDMPRLENESNLMLQKLGGMAQKMYERLLQHPAGLTSRQLALMCGYAVTSGSFRNARAKLKTMGLIKMEGETLRALTR